VLNPHFFSIAILVAVGLTMVSPILMRIASTQLSGKELNGAPSFNGGDERHRLASKNE